MRPTRQPSRFWTSALPSLARHLIRTMPWATLLAGCVSGTAAMVLLTRFAAQTPLDQGTVRITFLPAVAALAFVPHAHFRPLVEATPVPLWIASVGQTLLALPVLAVTCWVQLQLMASTEPSADAGHLPAVYPLLAQLTAWSVLTVAIATCCERTRYAALSGAIAVPVSFTLIAAASFAPALERNLLTPPAAPHAATVAWYAITAAALVLAIVAVRDHWRRYTRRIHL
jgi:hypothetical protein